MSFLSTVFLVFLAIVYACWRLLPYRAAKRMLCLAGLVFYAYWFPPFLLIFLTSGVIDYAVSLKLPNARRPRLVLTISILVNLGLLGFFKYADFFLGAWQDAATALGMPLHIDLIHVLLPIGLSFYTFQSLSYTIDVYRGRLKPCANPVDFFLFFSFFPHLVSGPILRAANFLPQTRSDEDKPPSRRLSDEDFWFFVYRLCRGYFLKAVVADNAAIYANAAFAADPSLLSSTEAWLGALFFAVQIFGDFAGYSDIAIGTARLFGYSIPENFNNPYWSFGIENFWRRWHMSLTSWFRDYLYIPLGGNRRSPLRTEVNILFVFLVSGFWHGANWTFLIWGALHGTAVMIEKQLQRLVSRESAVVRRMVLFVSVPATFLLVLILWVPFRAPGAGAMLRYWAAMFGFGGHGLGVLPLQGVQLVTLLFFVCYFALQVAREHSPQRWLERVALPEALAYFTLTLLMPGPPTDFIYFQF
jgi:alginate O-acetyltransferase complex protein AlgI